MHLRDLTYSALETVNGPRTSTWRSSPSSRIRIFGLSDSRTLSKLLKMCLKLVERSLWSRGGPYPYPHVRLVLFHSLCVFGSCIGRTAFIFDVLPNTSLWDPTWYQSSCSRHFVVPLLIASLAQTKHHRRENFIWIGDDATRETCHKLEILDSIAALGFRHVSVSEKVCVRYSCFSLYGLQRLLVAGVPFCLW